MKKLILCACLISSTCFAEYANPPLNQSSVDELTKRVILLEKTL